MAGRQNNPYDIASKMIVDADPVAFARLCGPADSAELLDTNFASNVTADRLLKVRNGGSRRIGSETPELSASSLWTEFDLLLGLKYSPDFVQSLLKGVGNMQESSTYQAIISEGEARGEARGKAIGERELIMVLGSKRFGEPDQRTRDLRDAIESPERLKSLGVRILDASSWHDLLA